MDKCWEKLPRELLSNIFRHLDFKYMKTEIIRWMATKDDDLLFTNTFVSSIQKQDVSSIQKQNFRRYYEDKQKKLQNKKIVEVVEDDEEMYEEHSKFSSKPTQQTEFDVVQKNQQNTLKTEVENQSRIEKHNLYLCV